MKQRTSITAIYPKTNNDSATFIFAPGPMGMFSRKAAILNADAKALGKFLKDALPLVVLLSVSGSSFSRGTRARTLAVERFVEKTYEERRRRVRITVRKAMTLPSRIHKSLTYLCCCKALSDLSTLEGVASRMNGEAIARRVAVKEQSDVARRKRASYL